MGRPRQVSRLEQLREGVELGSHRHAVVQHLGVVIASAVTLLLGFLLVLVNDIAAGAQAAWDEAGGVATQTATTWMFNDTVSLATALRDETRLHADAMAAAAGGQR